jgi:capsular exopolysaccharide synthesis family protein
MLQPVPTSAPAASPESPVRPFSLLDVPNLGLDAAIKAVRRRKWWLILPTVGAIGATLVAIERMTPIYESSALVMINPREQKVVDIEAVLSGGFSDAASVESELYVLQSRDLARRVVTDLSEGFARREAELAAEQVTFDERIEAIRAWGVVPDALLQAVVDLRAWLKDLATPAPDLVAAAEASTEPSDPEAERLAREIAILQTNMEVGLMGRSRVLQVTYSDESPTFAALVANRIVNEYVVQQLETEYDATRRASSWLNDRLGELKSKVEESEQQVQRFRTGSVIRDGRDGTVLTQEITTVTTQLAAAQDQLRTAQARLGSMESLLGRDGMRAVSGMLTDRVVIDLRSKVQELRGRQTEMQNAYLPRHPTMLSLAAELENAERSLDRETRNILQSQRAEVDALQSRVRELERALASRQTELATVNEAEVELRALQREADADRTLLDMFLARYKETEQTGWQQPYASVISTATVPASPVFPNEKLLLAFAAVLGLGAGFALLLARELLDRGIHSTQEVRSELGQVSLAAVPRPRRIPFVSPPVQDLVLKRPNSRFSEAIRGLLTNVLIQQRRANLGACVMLTSSVAGEGKSVIATALARVAAVPGKTVLVIDADLARPRLDRYFGLANGPGLADVIDGRVELDKAIQKDAATGVHVLPAGRLARTPASYMRSRALREIVAEMKRRYDVVLVDAAPVLALSDVVLVGKAVDACVFVVRWNRTRGLVARHALDRLAGGGVAITGVVLNQIDEKRAAKYVYGACDVVGGKYAQYYLER